MSLSQSVLEVCVHFIEKFTGGAGEHIIDEAPRRLQDLEGVGASSVFARGDPNDHICEEDENFLRNCPSAQRNRRYPIYKSILQCAFVVFRVIILVGSFSGVIGVVIIYVILNTLYHCEWIESTNPSLPLTTKTVREITDIISVLLIDHWLFFVWMTVFTWSAIVKSRVLLVNTIFVITDVTYRIVLQSQNVYIQPFIPYPMNCLYVLVLLVHSYSLSRIHFLDQRNTLKVAIRLCMPIISPALTTYMFTYVIFPYFVSLHGISKLLMATVAPFCLLPAKLLSRFCVLGLQGVIHPGTAFVLLQASYGVSSFLARAMQADLASMKMFVIYGVFQGTIHVLEMLIIMMGHWWEKFRSLFRCKVERVKVNTEMLASVEEGESHKTKKHRSPYTRRLITDMSLQIMLLETVAIILTTGVTQIYQLVYDTSLTAEQGAAVLEKLLVYIFVALFTEFFFHSLSVLLQTRYMNIPVVRVWEAKWRLHLWVAASSTILYILYLTQYYLPVVRDKYISEEAVFVNNTCTKPFN